MAYVTKGIPFKPEPGPPIPTHYNTLLLFAIWLNTLDTDTCDYLLLSGFLLIHPAPPSVTGTRSTALAG
jgi:hypothetical protein